MKRTHVDLTEIADIRNIVWAAWRAARGKSGSHEARTFMKNLEVESRELRNRILSEFYQSEPARIFHIRDPKPRVISAPTFRDRVVHHAVIRHVGPILDKSLIDDSFACRTGKGTTAAVYRAQHHVRRSPWFVKMDVQKYFASIHHDVLLKLLKQRIKGHSAVQLIERLVRSGAGGTHVGLPIGALTSQIFANYYLNCLDRMLIEHRNCHGYVRYMDDFVAWCDDKLSARILHDCARSILHDHLRLQLNPTVVLNQSKGGLSLCGFRILPGTIRMTMARRRRFIRNLKRRQKYHNSGLMTEQQYQQSCDALIGVSATADIHGWLRSLKSGIVARQEDCS